MFDRDGDVDIGDAISDMKSRLGRTQDEDCDFCGTSEGSVIVSREEDHPDIGSSPPVVRCNDCYNDPETYPDE